MKRTSPGIGSDDRLNTEALPVFKATSQRSKLIFAILVRHALKLTFMKTINICDASFNVITQG